MNLGVRWDQQKIIDSAGVEQVNLKTDFAPRVGVVWDPTKDHRTKVFGSFGYFYEQIPMDLVIRSYSYERQPVIYYNPTLMQKFGPHLTAFFMAHEYGHIYYRHTRAYALTGAGGRDSLLQLRELEADCYAATILGRTNRLAVETAARFFSHMGPYRFDAEHPSGGQRAAKILACLPPADPAVSDADRPAGSGSGSGHAVTISIQPVSLTPGAYGRNVRLWIDGEFAGSLTTIGQRSDLFLRSLQPGIHDYALEIDLYVLDDQMQFTPSGSVTGHGVLAIDGGEIFSVEWSPDSPPLLQAR